MMLRMTQNFKGWMRVSWICWNNPTMYHDVQVKNSGTKRKRLVANWWLLQRTGTRLIQQPRGMKCHDPARCFFFNEILNSKQRRTWDSTWKIDDICDICVCFPDEKLIISSSPVPPQLGWSQKSPRSPLAMGDLATVTLRGLYRNATSLSTGYLFIGMFYLEVHLEKKNCPVHDSIDSCRMTELAESSLPLTIFDTWKQRSPVEKVMMQTFAVWFCWPASMKGC